jgi:hypothetical protein
MYRSLIRFFAIIFCRGGAFLLHAVNCYVATGKGNDGSNGERDSPLETVTAAIVNARSGDSIIVATGTYSCSATINIAKNRSAVSNFVSVDPASAKAGRKK